MSAGTVDEKGLLWKSTQVGKFSEPYGGYANMYDTLAASAKKNGNRPAAGLRRVVSSEQVDGFEKLVLGEYQWLSYKDYFTRVENFGSGLASLGLDPGSNVVIYADTQYQWMLSAYGVWRQGLVVGTIYSTLGEEGAFYGMDQANCPLVIADGKLLKVLGGIATKIKAKRIIVFKEEDIDGPLGCAA